MALSVQATVPNGYVYVRACVSICMSAKTTAQNARLPPPLPLLSVLYPPDSLMSNLLCVCVCATWLQNLPNLLCLTETMWAEECQGRSQLKKSDC